MEDGSTYRSTNPSQQVNPPEVSVELGDLGLISSRKDQYPVPLDTDSHACHDEGQDAGKDDSGEKDCSGSQDGAERGPTSKCLLANFGQRAEEDCPILVSKWR
jgi:hypothetical protein